MLKRNPLMPLYVGIIVVLIGLQGIFLSKDYATGIIGVVIGSVLIVLFYRRQRNQPGKPKGS